jgi:hypothetical protein
MWKKYFGPLARIVTVDIKDSSELAEAQVFVRTGDQSDERFLNSLVQEFGAPDIVLDDGSHLMRHVNATFRILFPLMSNSGVYLVEDLDTAYKPEFGGGYKAPDSFIERCKDLIDELNVRHTDGRVVRLTEFSRQAFSISFFDGVVVIEKTPYVNKEFLELPGG